MCYASNGSLLDRALRGEDAGGRVRVRTRSCRAVFRFRFLATQPMRTTSSVLGESGHSPGIEEAKTTKAEVTSALHDAFAYCNRVYDTLTDAIANEAVKAFS
jgi:hypothetical protein